MRRFPATCAFLLWQVVRVCHTAMLQQATAVMDPVKPDM